MKLPSHTYVDKTYWILLAALVVLAILALSSAISTLVYARESSESGIMLIMLQIGYIMAGLLIAYALQFAPSWAIRAGGYALLGVSILLLWSMLIPGNPFVVSANSATRWVKILGIQFQPSELAKLSLIIVVADMLARIKTEEDKVKWFYRTLGLSAITILPILVGNLSTAVMLGLIIYGMWFLVRIPRKYMLSLAGAVVVALILGYLVVEFAFVRPQRKMDGLFGRATTWVSRIDDALAESKEDTITLNDDNYQRAVAKIAVARGSKSPFGVLPGNSTERDFLPLAFADYIFAIFVEENGIVGACFLIFIYLAILFRSCIIGSRYSDYAAMLMVMGLALMVTFQAMISMMVAVGIGPVTGQPLPLISKGGTSVIVTCIYFGILMAVSREQRMLLDQQKQVKQESAENAPKVVIEEDI